MKSCPQCKSVFDDALTFCTNDGSTLVAETFILPSETSSPDIEEETYIRRAPVFIDISGASEPTPTEPLNYQVPPVPNAVPVLVEVKRRSPWKNLFFLTIGLVLGGGFVLGAVLLGIFIYRRPTAATDGGANRKAPASDSPVSKPSPTPVEADVRHAVRTDDPDNDFNGRVITLNAYVRFLPRKESTQVDVLPLDDRLKIEERAGKSSPWYHVTCEHGSTGWMHGNTIEFTR